LHLVCYFASCLFPYLADAIVFLDVCHEQVRAMLLDVILLAGKIGSVELFRLEAEIRLAQTRAGFKFQGIFGMGFSGHETAADEIALTYGCSAYCRDRRRIGQQQRATLALQGAPIVIRHYHYYYVIIIIIHLL